MALGRLFGNGRFRWVVLIVGLLAILGSRCYPLLVAPTLRVEDGKEIFAYFYNHRDLASLFRFKGGYMPFGPSLFGVLSVRLPVQWTPYALTIAPFIQALFGFALFFCHSFRACVRSDALRLTVCLAMALAPVGQFHLLCHTDFSIWSALLIVCLIAVLPSPQNPWKAGVVLVFGQLFVWSNPLTFVAAPLHAVRLLMSRRWRARVVQALWLGAHGAHVAYGVAPGHAAQLSSELKVPSFWWELATRTWWHVASRAFFRTFFGHPRAVIAEHNSPLLIHFTAAIFVAALLLVVALGPRHGTRFTYLALAYLVAALTAAVVLTKTESAIAGGHHRYHYVQALLVVALAVLLLANAVSFLKPYVGLWLWPAFSLLVWGFFAWSSVDSLQPYTDPQPENAERIRACTERIAELERAHAGPCGFRLDCKKPHDWTISIRPPACP